MNTICSPFEIVPFKPEHLESFKENGGKVLVGNISNMGEILKQLGLKKTIFSGIVEGRVVAIAGIMFLWNGVGEAWASFTPEGEHYMKSIHRKSKEIIRYCLENGFWRIQTNILAGFHKGIKWVEGLGFKYEGEMRKFSPDGKDMIRYTIIKEEKNEIG